MIAILEEEKEKEKEEEEEKEKKKKKKKKKKILHFRKLHGMKRTHVNGSEGWTEKCRNANDRRSYKVLHTEAF